MTSTSTDSSSPAAPDEPSPADPASSPRARRRLLWWFAPGTMGISMLWGAIPGILLPLQVGALDQTHKAANLAVVTTIGAIAAMVAQPLSGLVSDRLRTRWGRRAPVILFGVACGVLSLIALALSSALWVIAAAWALVQFWYNVAQAPISAIVPDRVPRSARGAFSAVIGASLMVGALVGALVGAVLAGSLAVGYLVLAVLSAVLVTGFVVANRDVSNVGVERPPLDLRRVLSTFWVDPVRHPDFFWAFTGRLFLYSGYFAVTGYNLYLLQDYVGLGDRAAVYVPVMSFAGIPTLLLSIGVFGPLSDRLGRRKIFVMGSSAVVALAQVIPWALPTVGGMIAMAVVAGLGFGAFQAVDTALISEVLPDAEDFGKDLGVINLAATLPQTVAPALAGAVVVGLGYIGLFPVAIVLSLIGAILVLPIKSVR